MDGRTRYPHRQTLRSLLQLETVPTSVERSGAELVSPERGQRPAVLPSRSARASGLAARVAAAVPDLFSPEDVPEPITMSPIPLTIRMARRPVRWKGRMTVVSGSAVALGALILSARVLLPNGVSPAGGVSESPEPWTVDSIMATGSETATAARATPEEDPTTASEQTTSFDTEGAKRLLEDADGLADCSLPEVGAGTAGVAVTFAPTGRATTAVLEAPGPFAGTPVVACIVDHLRAVQVPLFSGDSVTIHTNVTVP
jgi:hypothetical protein